MAALRTGVSGEQTARPPKFTKKAYAPGDNSDFKGRHGSLELLLVDPITVVDLCARQLGIDLQQIDHLFWRKGFRYRQGLGQFGWTGDRSRKSKMVVAANKVKVGLFWQQLRYRTSTSKPSTSTLFRTAP